MQSTRWQIVQYLKEYRRASVNDLAEATGLTPMTVRHHLTILESEGLVGSDKERGGVGRPRHVYFLTEQAIDLFPQRYHELAGRLLEGLKGLGARGEITQVLRQMATKMTGDHIRDLAGKTFEERLDILVNVLGKEGFLAAWEEQGGKYILREYSCPYYFVGHEHPEICQIDGQIITTILETPVRRHTCMLDGDITCTFHIRPDVDGPASETN